MGLSKKKVTSLVKEELNKLTEVSGTLSQVEIPMGFVYDESGSPEIMFPDVPGSNEVYDANKFFRSIENGRRFKAWVKQNIGQGKENLEERGIQHNNKAQKFKGQELAILLPQFYGDMNARRGVLYHEEAGTDVKSICEVVPSIRAYIKTLLTKKGDMQGKHRSRYSDDVSGSKNANEEKLREIIREEVSKQLTESDDVEKIKSKVHEFWRELTIFNTKVAEQYFQDIATDLDSLQVTWDKSGEVKKEWMQMKRKFNNLIQDINSYKSFFEETMNSQESAEFEDTEDGYYRVEKGGDYYAT